MTGSDRCAVRNRGLRHRQLVACIGAALGILWTLLVVSGPVLSAPAESQAKAKADASPAGAKAKGEKRASKLDPAAKEAAAERAKKRADALARLASRLGVGQGGVVADIGAGGGQDTWVFAELVGPTGKVYAEEITDSLVKSLRAEAQRRKLPQVCAVLGRDDDPGLPAGSVDLAYMRLVYHHVFKPREMLRGIWKALKPGGHFVVVDQRRGTLRDWLPREQRAQKHAWLAETTVVREAREEGFAFVACAEDCCDVPEPFVLVFARPKDMKEPGRDPDSFQPLALDKLAPRLLPLTDPYQHPVFVALGEARQLMRPVLKRSAGKGLEIVLEEWATQKTERPPLPPGVSLPSVLTDQGDPRLGSEPTSVVFFLDTYHLLFHQKTLLAKLRERLAPNGCVYVMDREAKEPLPRREASHRRRIQPQTVKEEMAAAGFVLWFEGPRPAADRFLLVFGKVRPDEVRPEADPFVGGPRIDRSPGDWLEDNLWRLRGLKTANGKLLRLARPAERRPIERLSAAADGVERWRLPGDKLLLWFQQAGGGFLLIDAQTLGAVP